MHSLKYLAFVAVALDGALAKSTADIVLGAIFGDEIPSIPAQQQAAAPAPAPAPAAAPAVAVPPPPPQVQQGRQGGASSRTRPPTSNDLSAAQASWQADAITVSGFLSVAETLNQKDLQVQAAEALAATNDELDQKALLDRQFNTGNIATDDPGVQQASDVLDTQGTFSFLQDGLKKLSGNGDRQSQQEQVATIRAINKDRCSFVLPSIDAYFAATGRFLQTGKVVQATRPTNC